jgi:hypothetical protein
MGRANRRVAEDVVTAGTARANSGANRGGSDGVQGCPGTKAETALSSQTGHLRLVLSCAVTAWGTRGPRFKSGRPDEKPFICGRCAAVARSLRGLFTHWSGRGGLTLQHEVGRCGSGWGVGRRGSAGEQTD